jgi:glutamate N-acetyltransferase/amino-acid N-acetyltransferase
VATSLAKQIVADGEGVGHVVELAGEWRGFGCRCGGGGEGDCAFSAGEDGVGGVDPNWGRLMAAIGNSGRRLIRRDRYMVWRACGFAGMADGRRRWMWLRRMRICQQPEFSITIELHQGEGTGRCVFWTTDLTAEYVRINADYSTEPEAAKTNW